MRRGSLALCFLRALASLQRETLGSRVFSVPLQKLALYDAPVQACSCIRSCQGTATCSKCTWPTRSFRRRTLWSRSRASRTTSARSWSRSSAAARLARAFASWYVYQHDERISAPPPPLARFRELSRTQLRRRDTRTPRRASSSSGPRPRPASSFRPRAGTVPSPQHTGVFSLPPSLTSLIRDRGEPFFFLFSRVAFFLSSPARFAEDLVVEEEKE